LVIIGFSHCPIIGFRDFIKFEFKLKTKSNQHFCLIAFCLLNVRKSIYTDTELFWPRISGWKIISGISDNKLTVLFSH